MDTPPLPAYKKDAGPLHGIVLRYIKQNCPENILKNLEIFKIKIFQPSTVPYNFIFMNDILLIIINRCNIMTIIM